MGGERTVRVDATLFPLEADRRNAGVPECLLFNRRHPALDPGEGRLAFQALVQLAGIEIGENGRQLLHRLVDVDNEAGLGIDAGTRHVDCQQIAVTIKDRRPADRGTLRHIAGGLDLGRAELDQAPEHRQEHDDKDGDQKKDALAAIGARLNTLSHISRARRYC
ncbi:hypothetical protein D3C87_1557340 [compost metagenome]